MTNPKIEVRLIEWVAPSYEGGYTQYAIIPDNPLDADYGELWITQISTQDNMARTMQDARPTRYYGKLETLRERVQSLIDNRCEDGGAKELP